MTPEKVLAMAKENGAKMVDLRFMDFPGLWQHFSVPVSELEASSFEDGFGFDGSSIRGWQPIHVAAFTAFVDPCIDRRQAQGQKNIKQAGSQQGHYRQSKNEGRDRQHHIGQGHHKIIPPFAEKTGGQA